MESHHFLIGLLLGALLGGVVDVAVRAYERFKEGQRIALALGAEINALVRLAEANNYIAEVNGILARLDDPQHGPTVVRTDFFAPQIGQDYFSTFDSVSDKIGLLKPPLGAQVVLVYSATKSLFDEIAESRIAMERWLEGRPSQLDARDFPAMLRNVAWAIQQKLVFCVGQGGQVSAALQGYGGLSNSRLIWGHLSGYASRVATLWKRLRGQSPALP